MLPIDGEAEKIDIELARLLQGENTKDRDNALELNCHAASESDGARIQPALIWLPCPPQPDRRPWNFGKSVTSSRLQTCAASARPRVSLTSPSRRSAAIFNALRLSSIPRCCCARRGASSSPMR